MTHPQPRLALVEDYQDLREELLSLLASQGYPCWGVGSAEDFYKQLHQHAADIILVDIGLPGEDGLSLISHLRQHSACGIIVITARGSRDERLKGLQNGVDEYLVKPVDPDELCIRIDNLWRRLRGDFPSPQTTRPAWRFNAAQQAIISPQGQSLLLSEQEFTLLNALADNPGQVLSKQDLHRWLFPQAENLEQHRIDVILNRIRSKALQAGLQLPIRAVFGKGLTFLD